MESIDPILSLSSWENRGTSEVWTVAEAITGQCFNTPFFCYPSSHTLCTSLPSYHLYTTLLYDSKMSTRSMAPSSSPGLSGDSNRANLESIPALVVLINQYIFHFLENEEARISLKLDCTAKLKIEKQDFFEFSEHSILSNLYWGIDNVEATIQAKVPEERASRLKSAEQMLQVPALLDEHGVTAGIANQYLVCCSYFYLSVVRKLQQDELQVAVHFLQALLVSPGHVTTEFAPELCQSLFHSFGLSSRQGSKRSLGSMSIIEHNYGESGEAMRQMARRYKDWLIYYQVMLYGEHPKWSVESRDMSNPDEKTRESRYVTQLPIMNHATTAKLFQWLQTHL